MSATAIGTELGHSPAAPGRPVKPRLLGLAGSLAIAGLLSLSAMAAGTSYAAVTAWSGQAGGVSWQSGYGVYVHNSGTMTIFPVNSMVFPTFKVFRSPDTRYPGIQTVTLTEYVDTYFYDPISGNNWHPWPPITGSSSTSGGYVVFNPGSVPVGGTGSNGHAFFIVTWTDPASRATIASLRYDFNNPSDYTCDTHGGPIGIAGCSWGNLGGWEEVFWSD
jgi:hypothetical protein